MPVTDEYPTAYAAARAHHEQVIETAKARCEKYGLEPPAAPRRCIDCGEDISSLHGSCKRCKPCAAEAKKVQNREASKRNYRRSVDSRKKLARAAGVRDRAKPVPKRVAVAKQADGPIATPSVLELVATQEQPARQVAVAHAELEHLLHALGLDPNVKVRDLWTERIPVLGAAPRLVVLLEGPGLPDVADGEEIPHVDLIVRQRTPYEMEITR